MHLLTSPPQPRSRGAPTRRPTTSIRTRVRSKGSLRRTTPPMPDPVPDRSLPARLSLASQQSSSASSSAPRVPLWDHMLPRPGSGASPPGFSPWPQPRRRRLRRRRRLHAVLPGARPRQPVPSVGAEAATLHRGPPGARSAKGARRPLRSPAPARPSLRSSGSRAPRAPRAPAPWLPSCATEGESAQPRPQRPAPRRPSPRGVRLSAPRRTRGSGGLSGPSRLPQCRAPRLANPGESERGRAQGARGGAWAGGGGAGGGPFVRGIRRPPGPRPPKHWGYFRGDLARHCARGIGKPGCWILAGSGFCSSFFSKN